MINLRNCTISSSCSYHINSPLLQARPVRNELAKLSFGVVVPAVLNDLLPTLRLAPSFETFKPGLKTYLFREAFGDLL